jgi:hypothetical protein
MTCQEYIWYGQVGPSCCWLVWPFGDPGMTQLIEIGMVGRRNAPVGGDR